MTGALPFSYLVQNMGPSFTLVTLVVEGLLELVVSELPPRDYENVSIMSGNNNNNNNNVKNDKKSADAMNEENVGDVNNDVNDENVKITFATIYPVSNKPEVYIFDKPEVGEVALKDGFVFQRSEAVANAEGKIL